MNKLLLPLLFAVLFFSVSCTDNKSEYLNSKFTGERYIKYYSSENSFEYNDEDWQAYLYADTKTQKLIVVLFSDNAVLNDSMSAFFKIRTPDNIRTTLVGGKSEKHPEPLVILEYTPINSRDFYRFTALPGDFLKQYDLIVDPFGEKSVSFLADSGSYKNYKETLAIEGKTTSYKIAEESNLFTANQLKYLEKNHFPKEIMHNGHLHSMPKEKNPGSVNISDSEILINGILIKLFIYKINNEIFADVRLVNHSLTDVFIEESGIQIITGDSSLTYVSTVSDEQNKRDIITTGNSQKIVLRKSDRFSKIYKFVLSKEIESFELDLRGIKFSMPGKALFHKNIKFDQI